MSSNYFLRQHLDKNIKGNNEATGKYMGKRSFQLSKAVEVIAKKIFEEYLALYSG